MKLRFLILSLLSAFCLQAQTTNYQYTKNQHQKEIIGYFTNWDAWKGANHGVPPGFFNQLNIDYSQYTILNWSFFGVAYDGSLHSGDFRNQNIHQPGQIQQPAEMFNTDIYSSWDLWLRDGELEIIQYLPDDLDAQPNHASYWAYQDHGYKGNGSGWIHTDGTTGSYPLPLPKPNGAKGLIELAHDNNVKVMASIGGWSMSKHFPEMAADSVKRNRFIQDCVELVTRYDFDGIDIDWEFPGPFAGMNFTGSTADYANFTTLMAEIRAAIGPNKLLTAAFNAAPSKLAGFDWASLNTTMDYYNMMSYDFHGGWSNKAGHNSPLYPYTNQETTDLSWNTTFQYLVSQGVSPAKINMGVGFYGRGVNTNGPASLNAPTVKVQKNVNPDGPVLTASDYANWGNFDGTPNYDYIIDNMSGWTYHWDDEAKVPYLTKGNHFLSYDNVQSVTEKAKYVDSNNIAGVIIWQTFGDMNPGTVTTTYANKLPYAPSTTAPLVNALNEVFSGNYVPANSVPSIVLSAPIQTTISQSSLATIPVSIEIEDTDGTITSTSFQVNGQSVAFTQNGNLYTYDLTPNAYGNYVIDVEATDDDAATSAESYTLVVSNDSVVDRISHVITSTMWDQFFPHRFGVGTNNAGTGDFYSYDNFVEAIDRMANIKIIFERRCGTSTYKITRVDKTTLNQVVIREDAGFATSSASIITEEVDYGSFGNDGTLENQQREIMAFLANISQETTGGWPTAPGGQYAYGLYFNEEQGYSNSGSVGYVDAGSTLYPPTPGKSYHGRGPIQLSWNTNYGQVSAFLYGDKQVLLDNPENVLLDGAVAFQTAIWFWMTPQYPKPSAHDVMVENWQPSSAQVAAGIVPGFGATVNIINPAIECNSGTESPKVVGRIGHFDRYTDIIGIGMALDGSDNPTELGCANMSPFQIDVNECNTVTGIAFNTPNDGDTIAILLGDAIPLGVTVSDPNNALTNIQMSVSGTTFSGASASWVPTAFGNYTLTASAQEGANTITDVITVTLIDATSATGCEGVAAWSASDVYAAAGQEVVYDNKLYSNKWWTQNDIPDASQVWEYVRTCGVDTTTPTNNAPIISAVTPVNGTSFTQSSFSPVTISFTAADSDGVIQSASANVNGTAVVLTNTGSSYSGTYTPSVYGTQQLSINVIDNDNASSSAQISFAVVEPAANQAPVVSAILPSNGSAINQASLNAIAISFEATDIDGTVQSANATVNGIAVALTVNGSTYSGNYTPSAFGAQTLSISVMDDDSATSTAQSVFTVNVDTASSACNTPVWQAQVYATPGTQVSYNNRIYENQWYAGVSDVPGASSVWLFISYCGNGPDLTASCGYEVWDTNAVYATAGIRVFYSGKIYESKWWVTNEVPTAQQAWMFIEDCNPVSSKMATGGDVHVTSESANLIPNQQGSFVASSSAYVAPNPASSEIRIIAEKQILEVNVLDGVGRQVLRSRDVQIDVSELGSGLNFVQVQYVDGSFEVLKFLKKN